MGNVFPTKELLHMVEERIPGGRTLTTAALFFGVLAVIVASFSYLYRAVIFPMVGFIANSISTGRITLPALSRFVALAILILFLGYSYRYVGKRIDRLFDQSQELLDWVQKALQAADDAILKTRDLAERIESRLSTLEQAQAKSGDEE